ncbi:methyltransferase type 11 [Fusarium sp. NRRL 52700]|nr:methyltransferase type 11 [Fusarium sp. NRRL 52700]
MRIDDIRAWTNSIDLSSQPNDSREQVPSSNTAKRRLSGDSMDNLSKRKHRNESEAEAPLNSKKTPQALFNSPANSFFDQVLAPFNVAGSTVDSTDTTTVFFRTLTVRPRFPKPMSQQQRYQRSPLLPNQCKKRSDLHRLSRPIQFSLESDLKAALPNGIPRVI